MILALGVLFYALYRRTHPVQQARPASGGPYSLEIRPLPVSHTLALGDFEVPARSSHDVKIVLDEPHMQNARVTGNFSTESVSGIQVMLLNEIEYNQFTGDHKIPPGFLYLSKTTTNGNIQAAIPQAGNYYLVFDNSPSDSSIKVKAEVTVHYETVHVDTPPAQPPPPKK
jgi:hypothetical protein